MKDKNWNGTLLAIVLALSAWTLKEVVALKISVAEIKARIGMSNVSKL